MEEPPARHVHKPLVLLALTANLAIAVSKFVISFMTNSSSILAEAVHSAADSINQLLLLYGMKSSHRKPSLLHPFGYARESYFWAFMVAVSIFTLGGFLAFYRGMQKLLHPDLMTNFYLAYLVLILAAVFEAVPLMRAMHVVREQKKAKNFYQFLKNCKQPELIVVFLEDLMAEAGLAIAFVGVGLTHLTGSSFYDAVASLIIGVLLGGMAIFLTFEIRSLIVGERASQLDEYKIRRAIRETNAVEEIIKLSTQHLGPDEIMVAMNCKFPDYFNSQEIAEAIQKITENIQATVPNAKQIYIEPEIAVSAL